MPELMYNNTGSQPSRHFKVHELSSNSIYDENLSNFTDNTEVDALKERKYWNCGSGNHKYVKCDKSKTKFCYGCGNKKVMNPNCLKYKISNKQQKNSSLAVLGSEETSEHN